jgi:hypothetical protein
MGVSDMRAQKTAVIIFTLAVGLGGLMWSSGEWIGWFFGLILTLGYLPLTVSAWVKLISDSVRTNAGKPKRNGFLIFAVFSGIALAATGVFAAVEFRDITTSKHFGTAAVYTFFVLPVHLVEFLITLIVGLCERKKSKAGAVIYCNNMPQYPNYQNYQNYPNNNGYYPYRDMNDRNNDNSFYRQ